MHDIPLIVLVAALYWTISRAARMAAIVFRLLIALAIALLLAHGWL